MKGSVRGTCMGNYHVVGTGLTPGDINKNKNGLLVPGVPRLDHADGVRSSRCLVRI